MSQPLIDSFAFQGSCYFHIAQMYYRTTNLLQKECCYLDFTSIDCSKLLTAVVLKGKL